MSAGERVAVVGAGWAGLSAAVELTARGRHVTLFDMAPQVGGRARRVDHDGAVYDNGQHILIGAYRDTLATMVRVGVDPTAVLRRLPLTLRHADGRGLQLRPGPPRLAFVRAVLGCRSWRLGDRLALLRAAAGWMIGGFRCEPDRSVDALCQGLPDAVRRDLIDLLCVAALNTPASQASATVFLRVLHDALFAGPGSADLLLPAAPLDALLPAPALAWLQARAATLRLRHRVTDLAAVDGGWRVDDEAFGAVVLATGAAEAARLAGPHAPDWAEQAAALRYEPIVTVYVEHRGPPLPAPIVALDTRHGQPAQFVFDQAALGGAPGELAAVISGAAWWVDRGLPATAEAVCAQLAAALGGGQPRVRHVIAEKRATFACLPALRRPRAPIAAGLFAAGDYVEGPYPATLEGAVRSGLAAARALA